MTLTLQSSIRKSVSGVYKFFIGFILGIVIGVMGTPHPVAGRKRLNHGSGYQNWLSLGLTAGVCLELFSLIGSWFIAAVKPAV